MSNKAILIIMDGWGLGLNKNADAIQQANVPFTKSLYNNYPNSTLITYGEQVGLPEGQMGNSEVGHLNLGAGRIVYQELQRINVDIKNQTFYNNPTLVNSIQYALQNNKALHVMGLVSNGGVHSHTSHVKAIFTLAHKMGLKNIYLHAFTDGRDTDPKSGLQFVQDVEAHLNNTTGTIASVSGRYYAMDRDKRWERVALAYNTLVHGKGEIATSASQAIINNYEQNITDEFIKPTIITNDQNLPIATIKNDDAVICFNFRTDRCREITEVLTQMAINEHKLTPLTLHYTTMTQYDKNYTNVFSIYNNDNLKNTLGEVLEANNKTQIRIAETEKYPHVTFFFSGGRELPFKGETRIMKPSPKVATYDLQPEMCAIELTEALLPVIANDQPDFICLNYANADMVGHTGNLNAAIKAVETVDACVQRITQQALQNNYALFILADHGNADIMLNDDGSPNTAHTTNLVPFFVVSHNKNIKLANGKLADVAPTILNYMNIKLPTEMDGNILIS
jgi:2,3-bisphosphoglycerate-independent phosphoglycerate mutase